MIYEDEGRLTDAQGRVVNFKNAVIIMTSNIGSHIIQEVDDEKSIEDNVQPLLKMHFKPEFLNRIDEVIIFNRLKDGDIEKIVDIQLKELQELLGEKSINASITKKARQELVKEGFDPTFGARSLKRLIQRKIYDSIALKLLKGEAEKNSSIIIDYDEKANKKIAFGNNPGAIFLWYRKLFLYILKFHTINLSLKRRCNNCVQQRLL